MTRLFALLAALPFCLASLGAHPQEPDDGSRSLQKGLRETQIEIWLREIVERVQWPLRPEADLVALTRPSDVDAQGRKLVLGPWLWHRTWEFPLPMQLPRRLRSPFRGARIAEDGQGHLKLQGATSQEQLRWQFRLLRREDATPLWPGRPKPAAQLVLQMDTLPLLLPDPVKRRRFLREVLLPAFRQASAARAPDPGAGRRGRKALTSGSTKAPAARRPFHSRDLKGLPLLGFLKEDAEGRVAASRLQAAGFPVRGIEDEQTIRRVLLGRFLTDLRWPLPDPPEGPAARRLFPDDDWNRGGLEDHRALDLGSLSPIDGHPRIWPVGTAVAAPALQAHPYPIARKDGRAWIYEIRQGRYRLRLLLALYHLVEREGSPVLAPPPEGGFQRSDPWAVLQGRPKGPHTHCEILGLAGENTRQEAFFVRHLLSQALLRAPSAIAALGQPQSLLPSQPDPLSGALADLAASLPILPGLDSFELLGKVRMDRARWQFRASRALSLSRGWRLAPGRATWPIRPAGRHLASLRITGRFAPGRTLARGRLHVDFAFEGPMGSSFVGTLQAPLREELLSGLLPWLLLRRSGIGAK